MARLARRAKPWAAGQHNEALEFELDGEITDADLRAAGYGDLAEQERIQAERFLDVVEDLEADREALETARGSPKRFGSRRFAADTGYLGAAGQRRVLNVLLAAHRLRFARLEAERTIERANQGIPYPMMECTIGISGVPNDEALPYGAGVDLAPRPRPSLRLVDRPPQ
jgi:hypothetical protein